MQNQNSVSNSGGGIMFTQDEEIKYLQFINEKLKRQVNCSSCH